jgi:phosphoribosylglycinamide formyltransferase-1
MISCDFRLGFLASGNGSSAEAIVGGIRDGRLAAQARVLVGNRRETPAFAWADRVGLPHAHVPTAKDPDQADGQIVEILRSHDVNLVVLSGYLRRLGPKMLEAFEGRILNIHPGPLPEFGGEGMYGAHVHRAVIAAGAPESAIVVHTVDEVYDHGPEIYRRPVPILSGEGPESLEARIKALEPEVFLDVLVRLVRGDLVL